MRSKVAHSAFNPLEFRHDDQEFRLRFKEMRVRVAFGKNLKALIHARGLTVKATGDLAHVDDSLISRITNVEEVGRKGTGIGYMGALSLAQVLGVSLESMMTKDFASAIDIAIKQLDESLT